MGGRAETFVIVNYGAARARAAWAEVRVALDGAGVRVEAHEARGFGDARAAAAAALGEGYRTVAVVGGDGTLGEVVSGFFGRAGEGYSVAGESGDESVGAPVALNPSAALAILPGGTGNDFARALEGRRATLAHRLARLVAHCRRDESLSDEATTRAVDVLRGTVAGAGGDGTREFLCLNAVTLGVGAEVAARVAAQGARVRGLPGEARFALAALGALAGWRERHVRIGVDDGEPFESATNLIAVVNSRFAGGGMMFSPGARIDDGLADLVTASRLTRAVVVREMMRIHRGGHVNNPRVRVRRGSRVTIEPLTPGDALPVEADGDVRGQTPLRLSVMPRALKVVV
ncbi:MAG: hypothetical protein LC800_01235 [Acidobacteria bacterium]|nr:hypothetical protein [Acidobacteriota bacterium]